MSECSYRCAHCRGEILIPDPIYRVTYKCPHCFRWNTAELAGSTPDDPFLELRKSTEEEVHTANVLLERLRAMSVKLMKGEDVDVHSIADEIPPQEECHEED